MKTPWHYTYGPHFDEICQTGVILPATLFVFPPEKPVVWFSIEETWEPTVWKIHNGRELKFDGIVAEFSAFRISPNDVGRKLLHHYRHLERLAKTPTNMRKHLEKEGRARGANPGFWFFSLEPITLDLWESIQVFEDGRWIDLTKSSLTWFPLPVRPATRTKPR
jgi:hypothetical protein